MSTLSKQLKTEQNNIDGAASRIIYAYYAFTLAPRGNGPVRAILESLLSTPPGILTRDNQIVK